jgi:sarcosine oxidase, subunit beta
MSSRTADVIIVGAGIVGAATGYYLAKRGRKVLVVERDFPCAGSTGRCIGGIRAQFTHDLTVRIMLESVGMFRELHEELGRDVEWYQGGYLFLAYDEKRRQTFLDAIAIQRSYGLKVEYVSADDCCRLVPGLDATGLLGGAYCSTDGQANPFKVTYGYLDGIKRMGGELVVGSEVKGINRRGDRAISAVTNRGDELFGGQILLAAGCWTDEVGRFAGVSVPVTADRHESLVTEAVEPVFDPMLVDYRPDGCYFVQNFGTGHFIGCYTPVPLVPGHRVDATDEFITEMPRRMARLVPKLAHVKVIRQWAGSYEMSPDGNPICGVTPVENLFVSTGMSGHGFMFGPALGKLMAELMECGAASIPLDEFRLDRTFTKAESMK